MFLYGFYGSLNSNKNIMKTLEKSVIKKLPKANIIVDNDKYAFLDGIEIFAEKKCSCQRKTEQD